MEKLLVSGKTDLLKDFISARTRRKFSAFLVRGKDGKVGFEFEKREPKTPAKPKKTEALAEKPVKTTKKPAAKRSKAET